MAFSHWGVGVLSWKLTGVYLFTLTEVEPCNLPLLAFLSAVSDPRRCQGCCHPLGGHAGFGRVRHILQSARSYSAIAQWLHAQDVELWHALVFTRRQPKEKASRKLLMALSPMAHKRRPSKPQNMLESTA